MQIFMRAHVKSQTFRNVRSDLHNYNRGMFDLFWHITFTSRSSVVFEFASIYTEVLSSAFIVFYLYEHNGYEPEQRSSRETTYSHGENEQAARFDFGKPEETGRNQQQPLVRELEVEEGTCQAWTSYEEQTSLKNPRIQCGNPWRFKGKVYFNLLKTLVPPFVSNFPTGYNVVHKRSNRKKTCLQRHRRTCHYEYPDRSFQLWKDHWQGNDQL